MWQLCISVDKASWGCLDYIERKTDGVLKVRDAHGDRLRLSIAYDGKDREKLKNKIKILITDCIIEQYKQKYISEYISMPALEENRSKAFLQALVAFDRLYEHNYVLNRMDFEDYIAIDGYLNFRLKELKYRWKDVCELASLGGRYILEPDTYVDMLAFLVSNIDPKSNSVLIEAEEHTPQNHLLECAAIFDEPKNSINLQISDTESAQSMSSEYSNREGYRYLLTSLNTKNKPIDTIRCEESSLLARVIDLAPKSVCIASNCHINKSNFSILKKIYQLK